MFDLDLLPLEMAQAIYKGGRRGYLKLTLMLLRVRKNYNDELRLIREVTKAIRLGVKQAMYKG